MKEYIHKPQQFARTLQARFRQQADVGKILKACRNQGTLQNTLSSDFSGDTIVPCRTKGHEVVQRMVVVANDNYEEVTEPRVWNNVHHAETLAGGPIWDLKEHRRPKPNEEEGKQLRFVQHGGAGDINGFGAKELYDKMTHDDAGLAVMQGVESVVFQSCYAGKDYPATEESNLTFLFAREIAHDHRLDPAKRVCVFGKRQVSFGFGGIGDAAAVLEDAEFHKRLSAIGDQRDQSGRLENRATIAEEYRKAWKKFLWWNEGGYFTKQRVIDTIDGAEEGWRMPGNVGNAYIRKYLAHGGQVDEMYNDGGNRSIGELGLRTRFLFNGESVPELLSE